MSRLALAKKLLDTAAVAVCIKGRADAGERYRATCKAVHLQQVDEFEQSLTDALHKFFQAQLKSIATGLLKYDEKSVKNCGTGAGGFQPGNTCASGGGSAENTEKVQFGGNVVQRDEKLAPVLQERFGRDLTDDELSNVCGAMSGAKVRSWVLYNDEDKPVGIGLEWKHKDIEGLCHRSIKWDEDGNKILGNLGIELKESAQGKGLGTQIFHQQVQTAAALGINTIQTLAEGPPANGYYTWARLGYDGSAAASTWNKKPPEGVARVGNVSELMKTEAGRQWWKENGGDISMRFDTRAGSQSRKVLDAYIKEKFGDSGRTNNAGKSAGDDGRGRGDLRQDLGRSSQVGRKDSGKVDVSKIFDPDDWTDRLKAAAAPTLVTMAVKAALAQQKLMQVDIEKISKGVAAAWKNCGTGAGGFQPGNTCASGGSGSTGVEFKTDVTPKSFLEARNNSSRSPFLSPITEEDLKNHTLILTADGKAGAAVSPEGDIQNVFNNGGPKGVGNYVMLKAIESGGKTLDCFDGYLPGYYSNFGFTESGRMTFNKEYAPEGWDYDKYATPDVVFMALTKEPANDIKEVFDAWAAAGKPKPEKTDRYYAGSDWDQAKTDSRRIVDDGRSGKKHRSTDDGSRDQLRGGRVSSDNRRTVKATTATDWLNALNSDNADEIRAMLHAAGIRTEIPEWMKAAIRTLVFETFSEPYWEKISSTTLTDIEGYVSRGLQQGWSIRRMAGNIADGLIDGGEDSDYAKVRAKNIARTESGHVLNGARTLSYKHLKASVGSSLDIIRVWLSILGPTTRDAHADLDGVPENEDGLWILNGVECRWPSDVSLPASDRCNCQCSVVIEYGITASEVARLLSDYEERVAAQEKFFVWKKTYVRRKKNCGTGSGGFQPGNTCARGGEAGGESPKEQAIRVTSEFVSLPAITGDDVDAIRDSMTDDEKEEADEAIAERIREEIDSFVEAYMESYDPEDDISGFDEMGEDEREQAIQDALDSTRESVEQSASLSWREEQEISDAYYREFYDEHSTEPRFAGEVKTGVWGFDGDGDRAFVFNTSAGNQYTAWVIEDSSGPARALGEPVAELGFMDAKGKYGITGAGNAREVFRNVTNASVAILKEKQYPVMFFSAAEASRQKLYDRLVKSIAHDLPEYGVAAASKPGGGRGYIVAKQEKLATLMKKAEENNLVAEVLVGSRAPAEKVKWERLEPEKNPAWFDDDDEWSEFDEKSVSTGQGDDNETDIRLASGQSNGR